MSKTDQEVPEDKSMLMSVVSEKAAIRSHIFRLLDTGHSKAEAVGKVAEERDMDREQVLELYYSR